MNLALPALASVGILALVFLAIFVAAVLFSTWRDRRRRDRFVAEQRAFCRHLFNGRPRAKIMRVGTVEEIGRNALGPVVRIDGWAFDNSARVPISAFMFDGERDRELFLGWTREELVEATKHPAEFETAEVPS